MNRLRRYRKMRLIMELACCSVKALGEVEALIVAEKPLHGVFAGGLVRLAVADVEGLPRNK